VRDSLLNNEFGKACDAALKAGFDPEQIHEKLISDFFVQEGVIPGVAERFPRDILPWSQTQKRRSHLKAGTMEPQAGCTAGGRIRGYVT
jgi:hypothetical protein